MHQINLTDDQFEKLTHVAQAAGYGDVAALVRALANEASEDPRGELDATDLAASLELIRQSEVDIAAGRTEPMRDALRNIADKHDVKIQQ